MKVILLQNVRDLGEKGEVKEEKKEEVVDLIKNVMEKVFTITPVWRAEKHNTIRHLNESRQMDIEVAPTEKCYSTALNLPDIIFNRYSLDYKSFKIANNGIRKSAYSLSVEGPSWVSVEPLNITLNPAQSFNAVLKIEPMQDTAEGSYDFELRAESEGGYSEKKFTVTVKKKNAALVWIENFYKYNKYYLYLFITFLIVLFLLREQIKLALSRNYRIKKKRLPHRLIKIGRQIYSIF